LLTDGTTLTRRPRPRVLLADDNVRLLSALERFLEDDCDVIGRTHTIADLLDKALAEQPDVVVLDLRLPDGDGITACRRLKSLVPDTQIIIHTALEDDEVGKAAIDAGASAYVSKFSDCALLVPVILRAYETRQAAQTGCPRSPDRPATTPDGV
jgi:DNA-binding NarL/FixJ family response regulator